MIVWLMEKRHVKRMCVQWVFRVTSRNVCLSPPAHCSACSSCGHTPSVSSSLGKKLPWPSSMLGGKGVKQRPKSATPGGDPYFSLHSSLTATAVQLSAVTVECLLGGTQWSSVKYLLILNGEVIKWTELLNLRRISYFCDRCLVYFHGKEEHYHFCKCHQSLIIKIHLARKVVQPYRIVVIVTLHYLR